MRGRGSASLGLALAAAALWAGPAPAAAQQPAAAPTPIATSAPSPSPSPAPKSKSNPKRPAWARERQMTVFVDSVLLGAYPAFRRSMPDWHMSRRGRPALMVRIARQELLPVKRVNKLVVIGLAYNSLFERNRKNYGTWARRWDREARQFLASLRARGAQQFVWVNLREPNASIVNAVGRSELHLYSWFFPYVNERLAILDRERDDLIVADWKTAANRPGITYDSIHTNDRGSALMAGVLEKAIRGEGHRQTGASGKGS